MTPGFDQPTDLVLTYCSFTYDIVKLDEIYDSITEKTGQMFSGVKSYAELLVAFARHAFIPQYVIDSIPVYKNHEYSVVLSDKEILWYLPQTNASLGNHGRQCWTQLRF